MRLHHKILVIVILSALFSGPVMAVEKHSTKSAKAATKITAAKAGKKGKIVKSSRTKPHPATSKRRSPERIEDIEQEILALPTELRPVAFTRMLMLSSLVTPTLIADSETSGRLAARYSSGVALTRFSAVLKAAKLPAAAGCADKFARVFKDPAQSLVNSFPSGCAGFREINSEAVDLDAKKEDLIFRWATRAVQQGMAEAKSAGFSFQARPSQISLSAAYK